MMTHVDIDSSVAVYVQIENHVQFAIAAGKLKSGDQLPSVRELSERLSVNPNTVAKAYRDLEVMGLLYTRRGMGVFVNKGIESRCREDTRKKIISRLHEVISEAKATGFSDAELVEVAKKCAADNAEPYGTTPASILALAKGGGVRKKK
jgi:GntR family transcriptional regulator